MPCIVYKKYRCPQCGKVFEWDNGGDLVVSVKQLLPPACPKCGSVVSDKDEVSDDPSFSFLDWLKGKINR